MKFKIIFTIQCKLSLSKHNKVEFGYYGQWHSRGASGSMRPGGASTHFIHISMLSILFD